jgi:hypothetical protein
MTKSKDRTAGLLVVEIVRDTERAHGTLVTNITAQSGGAASGQR